MLETAREQAGSEDEEAVADDRSRDRGLDDLTEAVGEPDRRDDQLGGVAEGRVEEPADPGARPLGEGVRRPTHETRQRNDAERRNGEDRDRRRMQDLEQDRDGNEDEEQIDRVAQPEPPLRRAARRRAQASASGWLRRSKSDRAGRDARGRDVALGSLVPGELALTRSA